MALSKQSKEDIVKEVSELLENSKITVVANYKGTTVKQLQTLRKQAQDNGTKLKVVKNTLVVKALNANDRLKDVDVTSLNQQLMYAFNSEDEVAPAQAINDFAKKNPSIQFVGAITAEGSFMSAEDVKALAGLPSKPQLIASVIATLNSPTNDVIGGLSGGLSGILSGLEAKAQA